jgi:hypothetical protein
MNTALPLDPIETASHDELVSMPMRTALCTGANSTSQVSIPTT